MSDGDNYTGSVFLRSKKKSTIQHLKPLSVYSHMVCREQYGTSSPLCNIQIQITNKTADKRRLDDSCLDETCETPLKKPRLYTSCSPDQGCFVDSLDFLTGVHGSTQTKYVTQSKVVPPVTPIMSTPVSQCTGNRFVQARESLPSPIPVLKWDRDAPYGDLSLHASLNLGSCNSINVSLSGCQGDGKGEVREVSHVRIPARESKCRDVNPEAVAAEAVVEVKEKEASESEQTESKLEDTSQNEDSFEISLPLQVQV